MIDSSRIRATGQWVLLERLKLNMEDGLEKRGLLFIPNGTSEQRLGHAKARVVSVGLGKWDKRRGIRVPPDVKAGDVVLHRGYLAEINTLSPLDDRHAFIHVDDVLLVLDKEGAEHHVV